MTAATFRYPWSGDVTQAINPWNWFNQGLAQAGFINVNIGAAGNPSAEQQITRGVASYGRQLGILMDVMDILLTKLDRKTLSDGERAALERYEHLAVAIAATKLSYGSSFTKEEASRLHTRLAGMPKASNEALQELAKALQRYEKK